MSVDHVSFYLPERQALQDLKIEAIDPDHDWDVFGTGPLLMGPADVSAAARSRGAGAARLRPAPARPLVAYDDDVARRLIDPPAPERVLLVPCVPIADRSTVESRPLPFLSSARAIRALDGCVERLLRHAGRATCRRES